MIIDRSCAVFTIFPMKAEANLQFEIGFNLRIRGIPFELELSTPVGRLDIAICEESKLFGIIECKKVNRSESSFQLSRYRSIGVPVMVVDFNSDISECVNTAESWIKMNPVDISAIHERPGLVKKFRVPRNRVKRALMFLDEDVNYKD